jgi:hypothetical protein
MKDQLRHFAEPFLTRTGPPIARIKQKLKEKVDCDLVAPRCRQRTWLVQIPQMVDECLTIGWRPLPRVQPREVDQSIDQPEPHPHSRLPQKSSGLLAAPTLQHRLENRRLGFKMNNVVHQEKTRRTRKRHVHRSVVSDASMMRRWNGPVRDRSPVHSPARYDAVSGADAGCPRVRNVVSDAIPPISRGTPPRRCTPGLPSAHHESASHERPVAELAGS